VRRGEPEYGPWLRVPSPTRRFNTGSNSWRGRSSSNQQFGMESGHSASSNQKENEEDGHRTGTPVQSAQNNDGLASEGVSETPETHRGNHGIRSVMGESRDVVTRDLTLTNGKAVSVERERRSSGESTPQSKKMAAGLTGSINDGQSDMELEKEATPAKEKRSMARINDSETPAAGVSATRNENSLSNKQRVHAFNACGDNNAQRNKISDGSMGRKLVSYVENMDLAPPQGKEALHLHSNLNEPDSLTLVSLPILSQPGLQLNESRGMQRKQGSSWRRRARVSNGLVNAREEKGNSQTKRGGIRIEEDETPRKRGKKISAKDGQEISNTVNGSGTATAALQPCRQQ
jgi:hypothetical protein